MAATVQVTTDGKPNGPLALNAIGYDKTTNELYIGSGNGTADGTKTSEDAGELLVAGTMTVAEDESYGITWDQVADTYTRVGGTDYTRIQSKFRRCVLSENKQVVYYLHPNNSNLKEDGTPADLSGADGDVMVEVPLTYLKYSFANNVHSWEINDTATDGFEPHPAFVQAGEVVQYRYLPAYQGRIIDGKLRSVSGVYPTTNKTRGYFRDSAKATGKGFHQLDWLLYEYATLMAIIEYGTMNIQGAIGQGRTMLSGGAWSDGSYYGISGLSNADGNNSGNYTYVGDADDAGAKGSYVSYRGFESMYGNVWSFADGINVREHVPYINDNPNTYADDVFTGDYKSTGVTMAASNGYGKLLGNSSLGFFVTQVGASDSTGTTDYYYQAGGDKIALVGSSATYALNAGSLCCNFGNVAAYVNVAIGGGLSA